MKKTCIITFHSAENSGAVLQCYALQTAIERMGSDVEIINYQPNYIRKQYALFVNPFMHMKRGNYIKSFLAYSVQNILFFRKIIRKRKFIDFRQKYLKLTKPYRDIDGLRKDPPVADVYITGSDQLWNKSLTGGHFDLAFFLDFGNKTTKRFAYAISTGKELNDSEYITINEMAKGLDAVSFREESVCCQFNSKFQFLNAIQCVDPTFLLDVDDWKKILQPKNNENNYILVYALEKNREFQDVVNYIKSDNPNMKVIDISQCNLNLHGNVEKKSGFSPDMFLTLIYNADYVITNSFHCTVFSIIFEKNFLTIAHSHSNSRLNDLLNTFDLKRHLIENDMDSKEYLYENIKTRHRLKQYREESLAYLKCKVQI